MRRRLFFLLLLCGWSLCSKASDRFQRFDVESGLSQNSVYSILQDRQGRMWIGTADGLNLFDGKSFRVFKNFSTRPDYFPSNFITSRLCEDVSGSLILTCKDGLYRFFPGTGRFIPIGLNVDAEDGLPSDFLFSGKTREGIMYFSEGKGKVHRLDPGAERAEVILRLERQSLYCSQLVDNDHLLMVTSSGNFLMDLHHPEQLIPVQGPSGMKRILYMDSMHGRTWVITESELYEYDLSGNSFVPLTVEPGATLRSLHLDPQGMAWIGTESHGLIQLDATTLRIKRRFVHDPSDEQSMASGPVTSVLVDEAGALWVGTDGGGVSILDLKGPAFALFRNGEPKGLQLNSDFIRCMYWYNDELYIGTLNSGFHVYNPATDQTRNPIVHCAEGTFMSDPMAFREDSNGQLLLLTTDRLYKSTDGGRHFFDITWQTSSETMMRDLILLKSGEVLISHGDGSKMMAPGENRYIQTYPVKSAYRMHEDMTGRIWLSHHYSYTYFTHLSRSDRGYQWVVEDSLFDHFNLRFFEEDPARSCLWIATDHGLMRWNYADKSYKLITEQEGLSNNIIYTVFLDSKGRIWCSSNKGISSYDPESGHIRNYGPEVGLQSMEFNSRAYTEADSGMVYIGGVKGFNAFYPSKVKDREYVPRPFLTEVIAGGIRWPLDSILNHSISIDFDDVSLYFAYSNTDYSNHGTSLSAYMLSGRDSTWTITSASGDFRIDGLREGSYRLLFKACNADGIWSNPIELGRFEVSPPFVRSPLFFWLALLAGGGLLAAAVAWIQRRRHRKRFDQLERQRELQNMRLRISRDIHDDIGAGLSRIALMSELMIEKGPGDFPEKIAGTSRELTRQLGHIVWSLNPENDSLANTWSYIRQELSRFFEDTPVKLHVHAEITPGGFNLDPRQRVNLIRTIREAANNALKYSGMGHFSVEMSAGADELRVHIEDDGKGFLTGNENQSGNGLRNMRKRIEEAGGRFVLTSTPGAGTSIDIYLPVSTT